MKIFLLCATGKQFQQRQIHLFRMRAGQIVEHLALRDDLALLHHLGALKQQEIPKISECAVVGKARDA